MLIILLSTLPKGGLPTVTLIPKKKEEEEEEKPSFGREFSGIEFSFIQQYITT